MTPGITMARPVHALSKIPAWLQVVQLEARLEASHTMVQSLSQANSAASAALQESRQQHAAELQRLGRAQDALVSAAAREASAVEAEHAREHAGELQGRLQVAQRRIDELQREVQVRPAHQAGACELPSVDGLFLD